jgi:hypothetical protein
LDTQFVELVTGQLFHSYSFKHKRVGEIVSLEAEAINKVQHQLKEFKADFRTVITP